MSTVHMSSLGATASTLGDPTWGGTRPAHLVGDVRLTRRGRLTRSGALLALTLLLVLSVGDVLGSGRVRAADPAQQLVPVSTASVVVVAGDSLWGIAERSAPLADPRETVVRIRELNGLRSNTIQPGQVLLLPHQP